MLKGLQLKGQVQMLDSSTTTPDGAIHACDSGCDDDAFFENVRRCSQKGHEYRSQQELARLNEAAAESKQLSTGSSPRTAVAVVKRVGGHVPLLRRAGSVTGRALRIARSGKWHGMALRDLFVRCARMCRPVLLERLKQYYLYVKRR